MTASVDIHVIAGPTASGKSALAISKAQELNGVIINADSMQIYDALPLLAAQPSADDKTRAPHLLYGILPPQEKCSAGRWCALALQAIEETLSNGQTPIITGGSGLYIKALIEGLSPMPDVPPEVRARVMAHYAAIGPDAFYAELQQRDPVMAARFHPHHSARIIRAYEVLEATGTSLSVFQDIPKQSPPAHWRFHITRVMPNKSILDQRCDQRFDHMIAQGAIDEVRDFYARHDVPDDALIHHALGAAPIKAYIGGRLSFDDAIKRGKLDTRQYAKRQSTWFRNQIKPAPHIILAE